MEESMKSRALIGPTVRSRLTPLLFAALAFGLPAAAQEPTPLPPMLVHADGEKSKFSGVIVRRDGDKILVRQGDIATHTVLINDDTRISTPSGLFKMDRKKRDASRLLPGLMLEIQGRGGPDGTVVADEIHFSSRSMKTAEQINVGGEVTRNQVAANTDSIDKVKRRLADSISHVNARVTNLDNYDEKISTVVNFAHDSWELGDGAKKVLDDMAARVAGLSAYYIEAKGYADTTGASRYNLDLSQRRAEAVVRYLTEEKNIPLRRLLNPTGFGEASAIASNSTPDGRAMNRRATVRVLVSRGR
jgi:OOP family OmpA-OmpF porin